MNTQTQAAEVVGSSGEVGRQRVGTRLGNLSDLPPQLRALLTKPKTLQDKVCDALAALDGVATTDELLVMVYRQTGRVYQRRAFEVTLYGAASRGRIGMRRLNERKRDNRRTGAIGKVWTLTPNDRAERPQTAAPQPE